MAQFILFIYCNLETINLIINDNLLIFLLMVFNENLQSVHYIPIISKYDVVKINNKNDFE